MCDIEKQKQKQKNETIVVQAFYFVDLIVNCDLIVVIIFYVVLFFFSLKFFNEKHKFDLEKGQQQIRR